MISFVVLLVMELSYPKTALRHSLQGIGIDDSLNVIIQKET